MEVRVFIVASMDDVLHCRAYACPLLSADKRPPRPQALVSRPRHSLSESGINSRSFSFCSRRQQVCFVCFFVLLISTMVNLRLTDQFSGVTPA